MRIRSLLKSLPLDFSLDLVHVGKYVIASLELNINSEMPGVLGFDHLTILHDLLLCGVIPNQ